MEKLPFKLTKAQEKVLEEIDKDMENKLELKVGGYGDGTPISK